MGQVGSFACDADAQVSVSGEHLYISAAEAAANSYASTIPNYVRTVSLASAASYTLTLPTNPLRGQSCLLSWTLTGAGSIFVSNGSVLIFASDPYAVSATGSMSFVFDGAVWSPARGVTALKTLVAASGNIYGCAMVAIATTTFAYASTSALTGLYGVTIYGGAAAGLPCRAVLWGSQPTHVCTNSGGSTEGDELEIGADGALATASGAGVRVGFAAETVTTGNLFKVSPIVPYVHGA